MRNFLVLIFLVMIACCYANNVDVDDDDDDFILPRSLRATQGPSKSEWLEQVGRMAVVTTRLPSRICVWKICSNPLKKTQNEKEEEKSKKVKMAAMKTKLPGRICVWRICSRPLRKTQKQKDEEMKEKERQNPLEKTSIDDLKIFGKMYGGFF